MPAQGGDLTSHNDRAADVIVVGAGVIGLAIAWRAAQRGLRALVLDKGAAGAGTSHLAAGMLAPIAEVAPHEEPLLDLGLVSARGYPEFVRELSLASGHADLGYRQCGTLLLARDRDEAEALDRAIELRRRFGLSPRRLRASEARALEPSLAPTLRLALDVPDDHAIDPRRLTAALAEAVARCGGTVREHAEVASVSIRAHRVDGVVLRDGDRLDSPQVVVATGVWSGELQGIPDSARVPVRPVKGQILRLHDPSGPGLLERVVRFSAGYVVPRGDGRYVIGATMEERGFDTTVTAGAVFELLRDAGELVPGVSELVLDELSAGLRPATPDNVPVIGRGGPEGLYWATGHRRGGILLAPVTATLVADLLAGGAPAIPVALDPARFAQTAARSAA
jgi:glycine oxidase